MRNGKGKKHCPLARLTRWQLLICNQITGFNTTDWSSTQIQLHQLLYI